MNQKYVSISLQGKRKPELSIPVYGGALTKPRSLSQGSPVSELNSANENDRKSSSDFSSSKTSDTKFSYLYPYDEMFTRKSSDLMKSKSNSDLREESTEINNNRMGAGFTKLRPRAAPPAPPAVPNKTNKTRTEVSSEVSNDNQTFDDTTNNNRPDLLSNVDSKLKSAQSFNDNIHMASDSSWKNSKNQQRYSGKMSENWDSKARRKHDSGFHSDATNPSDKLYYSGFKSELNSNDIYLSSKNMAGSSTPLNQGASFGPVHLEKESLSDDGGFNKFNSDQNVQLHKSCIKVQINHRKDGIQISKVENDGLNTETKCVRNPVSNHRPHSSGMQDVVSHKTERTVSPKSQHLVNNNVPGGHPQHGGPSHSNAHNSQHYSASYAVSPREQSVKTQHGNLNKDNHGAKINNEHCGHKGKHVERSSSGGTKCNKRHSLSPKQRVPNGYSQMHGQHSPRGYSQNPAQQLPKETQLNKISYVETDKSIQAHQATVNVKDTFEKEDPVLRAQSLGDLTAGCTFSLVGQKKAGSVQALTETEFTGSQLAKHFRKYREMKPEINHGSLPGRMKCMGHETKARPKLENMNIQPDNQLQVYSSGMGGRCKKQQHYGSLQHLPMSETRDHRDLPSVRNREKTPIKPRRTLPQVPGDVDERKKQYTDMVKFRLASRNSSSPSSRNSNRPVSCENRQGGISATPSFSDREVSELLEGTAKDYTWVPTSISSECNKIPHPKNDVIPPDAVYDKLSLSYPLYSTGPFVSQEHTAAQTGTRHCESGQNTITSQSTVDSGYITNDPETENNTALSTSSYAKSLKESSNKLFKPSKGDYSVVAKGDSSKTSKHQRDHETRNWIEKHPGAFVKDMKPKSVTKDVFNNTVKENVNSKPGIDDVSYVNPKKQLTHRTSEISLKEAEKYNHEKKYFKPKVKAVSMSYGLNLIESSNSLQNNNGLSKSQPKFTGSLINLTHTESQGLTCAPSLDSLKSEIKTATLPGGWRYSGGNRTESSLKMLGKPSLFQLLQNYSVYPVRLKIPENFSLLDNIRLIECEVVLPSPWTDRKDVGTVTSPKGSYAKLGGPNSAFKPVVAGGSTVGSVSMVTVVDITNQMNELYELGQINKGDLIVEVRYSDYFMLYLYVSFPESVQVLNKKCYCITDMVYNMV